MECESAIVNMAPGTLYNISLNAVSLNYPNFSGELKCFPDDVNFDVLYKVRSHMLWVFVCMNPNFLKIYISFHALGIFKNIFY